MKSFRERKDAARRKASLNVLPNTCGECQACCFVPRVDHVDKKPYEPCVHQCTSGCAIHSSKPAECGDYACLYLQGQVPDRPDKSGLLIDLRHPSHTSGGADKGRLMISVYEVWPDAALDQVPFLQRLVRRTELPVCLVPFDAVPESKFVMPFINLSAGSWFRACTEPALAARRLAEVLAQIPRNSS